MPQFLEKKEIIKKIKIKISVWDLNSTKAQQTKQSFFLDKASLLDSSNISFHF